jgi:hypothetical protein
VSDCCEVPEQEGLECSRYSRSNMIMTSPGSTEELHGEELHEMYS